MKLTRASLPKYLHVAIVLIPLSHTIGTYSPVIAVTVPTQEVSLKFKAKVGRQPFECGKNYNLGSSATSMTASDFRFYVSDVALIDRNGKAVPLKLAQDDKWQHQNVALLDFENKSGACSNGTTETRDRVVGTVPKGNYRGLQFTLGVPFALNHADSAIAPSPLNLTSLWWNWLSGYKFLRVDLVSARHGSTKEEDRSLTGDRVEGFPIHLGSIGCQAADGGQKPSQCNSPNRTKVVFAEFNPQRQVVVADLKALTANSKLNLNQADTPPGCMSSAGDRDCASIMNNLGLRFGSQAPSRQKFFKFE